MACEIRTLRTEELPSLTRLFDYNDADAMIRDNRRRMEAGQLDIYALFEDGVLTGELHVIYENDDPAKATIPAVRAYLCAFRVHESAQGRGLGQMLLCFVLDELHDRGYREYTIGVEDDNPLARHIYEKFGFTEVIARCAETYQGDSYEYDLLLRRDEQNIFDDPTFFEGYRALRENPYSANELIEKPALFALSPALTGKRVLDMGCGYGENCREFVRLGAADVVGIDISEKMLAVAAEENACERVRFLRWSMSDLAVLPGEFDVIFSSLAMHYVKDFPALARAAYAHLAHGGYLIFSQEHPLSTAKTDNIYWERDAEGNILHYRLTNYSEPGIRHTRWFVDGVEKYHRTFSDILNALIAAGFTIDTVAEPIPTEEIMRQFPRYRNDLHKPDFLLLKARKE